MTEFPWYHWASVKGSETAFFAEGKAIHWYTLADEVSNTAGQYQEQGLKAGDTVLVCEERSAQFLYSYLAILALGGCVFPINPQFSVQKLAFVHALGLSFCLQHPLFEHLPLPQLTIATNRQARLQPSAMEWNPERPASLVLSSGSTGIPKAVLITTAAHLTSARALLAELPFTTEDCWLLSLPLFHIAGQAILWRWLLAGGKLHLPYEKESIPPPWVTHASLVPTQLQRFLTHGGKLYLRHVLLGGSAIPNRLLAATKKHPMQCWVGYGMTETASTVTLKKADANEEVGTPLRAHQIQTDSEGTIRIKSEALALGYMTGSGIVPLPQEQGYFITRDRGRFSNGRLTYLGRTDNLFISGGENIQPETIEKQLLNYPSIQGALIIPVPDDLWGARPLAILQLKNWKELPDIKQTVRKILAPYERPIAYLPLPTQLQGIDIKQLRKAVQAWFIDELVNETPM